MKQAFTASFLAFLIAVGPSVALAATDQSVNHNRYFVQTTKPFWRGALGARHVFEDGFTAELSGLQLSVAKFAGLKPIAVKNFTILETPTTSPNPTATPTPQSEPAKPLAWGVRYILGSAEASKTVGGKGVKVAILDTGIDRDHPDLKNRIVGCVDYADAVKGVIDNSCSDLNGHGTHVAGIIAADGGSLGKGIWGIAPQSELLIYRVCSRTGNCLSDDIATAMKAAVDAGANVIVLGLGGEAASSFMNDAVAYAQEHEVLVVAAAGNDGPYEDSLDWPARTTGVVSVGAITSEGVIADFSSHGINSQTKAYELNEGDIELVAPGVNTESTFKDGSYAILSGTSMAAAHIAGLAATLWMSDAKYPAQDARVKLHEMAKDMGDKGDDDASGFGVPRY